MDERREFGLRRLLLNLLGKQRAHDEVQAGLEDWLPTIMRSSIPRTSSARLHSAQS
jgi:hypothetical protein